MFMSASVCHARARARYITYQYYHDVGTCRMGPPSDPLAVVDPELRVYGVRGLRVADASIMPEITSGNTAVPARRRPTLLNGKQAWLSLSNSEAAAAASLASRKGAKDT